MLKTCVMRYGVPHTLAFVDIETTGKPNERVVEICVALTSPDGVCRGPFTRRIKPPIPIFWYATKVHGLRDEHVQSELPFRERAPKLHALLNGTILVAHAAPQCEVPVLQREFAEAGQAWPFVSVIDTLTLSRKIWPGAKGWTVTKLTEEFGFPMESAHCAEGDVRMLMRIWDQIYQDMGASAIPASIQQRDLRVGH